LTGQEWEAWHKTATNVFLGYKAGYSETGSNKLYIENSASSTPLIWGDFANDSVRINGDLVVTGDFSTSIGIDDLSDGKTGGNSVFLGTGAGANDDETDNKNVAVGDSALNANTSGYYNTAIGYKALFSDTSGNYNTAIGQRAMYKNKTGLDNIAIGMLAGFSNMTGNNNVVIGRNANGLGSGGSNNTIIGHYAGYCNSGDFSGNVFLGYKAGRSSFGDSNIFIGYMAGNANIGSNKLYIENSGSSSPLIWGDFANDSVRINGDLVVTGDFSTNIGIDDLSDGRKTYKSVFLGKGAGHYLTCGGIGALDVASVAVGDSALCSTSLSANTAIGYKALYSNIGGTRNTAIGCKALYHNQSGCSKYPISDENTAIGVSALYHNTIGWGNVGVGNLTNYYNKEGSNNTIIGYEAGYGSVTHSKSGNVFLGYNAGYNDTTDNKLYIENSSSSSPLIWGDFANDRIVINGNSGDNTNNRTFFSNGSAGGTTAWFNDSDIQLKKNIHTISSSLDKVLHLRGVNYEWKETENHVEGLQMGFIAQEVMEIIPEVVDNSGDHYSMQYAPITALLVEAVKEQQKMIEELKKEIEELKRGPQTN